MEQELMEVVTGAIVTGAMRTLLPKLSDLLKEEYKLQKSVRGGITFLKTELERMEAALLEISKAPIDQPPNRLVKLWARDVRELSYDIKDSIDKFMVRIDTHAPNKLHGLKGFLDRSLNLLTKAKIRRKIGTEIKDIKTHVKEVSELRDRYKVDNVVAKPVGPTIDSLRLSALYKKTTELIGIEEKSNGLIERLMEGDEASKQQLKIVSIVGFGGLGKTTLANVVYQKLKAQFKYKAFVSVSLNPDNKVIMKKMLHQLGKSTNEATWDEAQLIRELSEFLQEKRYFIVLDDIWNTYVWEVIKYALVDNEYGSKIIITTRKHDVANQVGGVYPLEPLSFVDSRKLFYQRIFGIEDKCPSQLAEVSEKILKKCGGVPLAIITIASLLASKKEKENALTYWSKVYQSIGSGLKDSPDVDNMRRILSISYYDLPPHLKTCLLYLSLYPEDYEIRKDDLIWKWVGEGFVQGKSLYEVGEDYFNELINRSLIQPGDIGTDDKLPTCRVHDMVLDFITSLSKEEYFLTALNCQQQVCVPSKVHRLSLQTSNEDVVTQLSAMSMSHVRSLTVVNQTFVVLQNVLSFLPALSSFQVLRALDLRSCKVENHHCKDICKLLHLRYLGLRGTYISEIPKEIGNLRFLQVLNILFTNVTELPSTFLQLGQMVHLHVHWETRLPDGFGNLKCLQDLRPIRIWSSTMLRELGGLTELRRLELRLDQWHESFQEPLLQCLSNLASLEILEMDVPISSRNFRFLGFENLSPVPQQLREIIIWGCVIHAVPRWMSSLSSLSSLRIGLETLGVEDLQVLGSIPSLGDLTIWVKEPTQRLVIGSDYPFRCLTRLRFNSHTIEVVFAQGAMQKLQTLKLVIDVRQTIDRFGDFEFGLENLSSLGHVYVEMWGCSEAMHGDVEAAIRKALETNSNKPTIKLHKMSELSLKNAGNSSRASGA